MLEPIKTFLSEELTENINLMRGVGAAFLDEWLPTLGGLIAAREALAAQLSDLRKSNAADLRKAKIDLGPVERMITKSLQAARKLDKDDQNTIDALSHTNAKLENVAAFMLRRINEPDFNPKPEQVRYIENV